MIDVYKNAGERVLLSWLMRGYTGEVIAELTESLSKFQYEIETGWCTGTVCVRAKRNKDSKCKG